MTTYEVIEKHYQPSDAPVTTTTDYLYAKRVAASLGGSAVMREKLAAVRQRVHPAQVYAFSFDSGWANFTLCEETGDFSLQSDWGDYQYSWPSPGRGKGTLHDFVATAGTQYLADKLTSEKSTMFSSRRTAANILRKMRKAKASHRQLADVRDALEELLDNDDEKIFSTMLMMHDDMKPAWDLLGEEMWRDVNVYDPLPRYCFLRDSLLIFFQKFLREQGHGKVGRNSSATT